MSPAPLESSPGDAGPAGIPAPSPRSRLVQAGFVWAVWALAVLGALAFVRQYASRLPLWDDWYLVGFITRDAAVTPGFLWEREENHRYGVFKVIAITLGRLTGADFRAVPAFDAVALGGLAFALIRVARRLRGWTSYADAFFPLALLHPGGEKFAYTSLLNYLLPTLFGGALLALIALRGTRLTLRAGLLAGVALALMTQCAAGGLAYVPALGLWLVYCGFLLWRSPEPERGVVIVSVAGVALALVPAYFIGYESPAQYPGSPSKRAAVRCTLEFLAAGAGGPAAWGLWPYSGYATLGILALSAGALLLELANKASPNRPRALGLLFFAGAVGLLALGIGWGRASSGRGAGFTYGTLAIPAFLWVYFAWATCRWRRCGQLVQFALFAFLAFATVINVPASIQAARERRSHLDALERDLRAGTAGYVLLAHHWAWIGTDYLDTDWKRSAMSFLQKARLGPFRDMGDDPPAFAEEKLDPAGAEARLIAPDDAADDGESPRLSLTLTLPEPRYVAGIRLQFRHSNAAVGHLRVFWRRRGTDFPAKPPFERKWYLGDYTTVYVADTIDQIRIFPDDGPCDFQLTDVHLLVPEPEATESAAKP